MPLRLKQLMQGELTGLGTGATVWPAAHVLAKYLEKRWPPSEGGMRGLRVIELGAGTGAVGLAARALGAQVTLTDQEQLHFLMRENSDRAEAALRASELLSAALPVDYAGTAAAPATAAEAEESTAAAAAVQSPLVVTYDWGGSEDELGPIPFDVVLISDCVLPKLYPSIEKHDLVSAV